MNKGRSVIVGTAVLAGAMVYAGVTFPNASAIAKPPTTTEATLGPVTGEGPWRASCKYWTAARLIKPLGQEETNQPKNAQRESKTSAVSQLVASMSSPKTDCEGDDDWGIPQLPSDHIDAATTTSTEDLHQPEIRVILASVPDPIHSHLALEFDRTIDSFMQAAADRRYLSSNYWFPWKIQHGSDAVNESSTNATNTEEDRYREQQPGLIILKYSPQRDEKNFSWLSYHRVIYLFLVSESPALGMNGLQLRNALRYEAMLRSRYGAKLSMSDDDSQLAVIGPGSSGSAASLREGIVNAPFAEEVIPSEEKSREKLKTKNGTRDGFEGANQAKPKDITNVIVAGTTSTLIADAELNSPSSTRFITYYSFGEDTVSEEHRILDSFRSAHSDEQHIAILSEDDTVFGEASSRPSVPDTSEGLNATGWPYRPAMPDESAAPYHPIYIRFPREISLLRNAQGEKPGKNSSSEIPTPYLNLTLKDSSADDTMPRFSTTQTPLSQEAQLMAIAHQLQRARVEYILITASNILDELFLAEFLHRACPDARIVFYNGGDLLVERDVDNARYIGSLTISPYNLTTLSRPFYAGRAFSDSQAEATYNAASYILWKGSKDPKTQPLNFSGYLRGEDKMQAPLWATAVGSDGYYPLGLVNGCASEWPRILPSFHGAEPVPCSEREISSMQLLPLPSPNAAPSLAWSILCVILTGLCIGHAAIMLSAEYWSPFTRDLAIDQNDQPRRRSVYINIGTSVLFCMSFVLASPMFLILRVYRWERSNLVVASMTLLVAVAAVLATLYKTWPYLKYEPQRNSKYPTGLYFLFNLLAFATLIVVPLFWLRICLHNAANGVPTYVGLFFSYRSLHPGSGVSPVIPVLLLLFGWYLWAIFQTARLRFSTMNRPRLPDQVAIASSYPLYVPDRQLSACRNPTNVCLFENISCLLITREILRRFTRWPHRKLNVIFFIIYLGLFLLCVFCGRIQSLERFLLHPSYGPTPYEFLIAALFFPLIMVVLTGWLRMIFVWGSLSRGLLEPLERMPIRAAFSRLKEVGWMTMLSQSSLHIRWRDMARSNESVRQLVNNEELRKAIDDDAKWTVLKNAHDDLSLKLKQLREHIQFRKRDKSLPIPPMEYPRNDCDLPPEEHRQDLSFIYAIEKRYAAFCELILSDLLIPYWDNQRVGFVEDDGDDLGANRAKPETPAQDPLPILLAEELLVIRYVALIRSVLVNIRYLMLFTCAAFVLSIVAWNSYPFQPHQLIDWCFTLLLVFLGTGVVWVFAQMHRNSILSRITDTAPNKLGLDFYIRIVTFGAAPVLTWLAYQFPDAGGNLLRILQPGLQVVK
ncbi:hypothetical protein [Tunturiibacter gelidoferens]|uniref:Uncharacterized protein n=1 Tax=Tunturiibacter lichenicola TaxID=2051959 RepID=A0A7Y9NJQ1_9BACT|nr:hypothetical protein [Edaphobacter lichenicola]NYF50584.1 hypothetical protein [Edaphobacter lichenicola]